jgi:hypothetical protein
MKLANLLKYTDLSHRLAKGTTQHSLNIWIHASGDDNQDKKSEKPRSSNSANYPTWYRFGGIVR